MCMKVAKASFYYNQAVNLAYEKLFELEVWQREGLESGSLEGEFSDNKEFNWKETIEKLEDKNLGKLFLEIKWIEKMKNKGFCLETYVRTKD